MSELDEIIYRIGSPWGEGATYEPSRTLKNFKDEGLKPSSHMSSDEEVALKAAIKDLMLDIIPNPRDYDNPQYAAEVVNDMKERIEQL